ncbi:uncharacterized protein YndB with AHSA1/START domain [Kibdelosporangium banguiense]|uniref:Uncharacterized protein YndB with AHSA1/START domain n=1 Tax=Kibdelosporangium banguiense TaxID=1365924 RepID=A0ABS4T877_9PSEU|nr:SRPBCC domain-containing protein [Kibdelosporangium banguiense]MBP2320620.1 uncharacterized protein YndB with AHSA1/START domain [Kibdelosporangium banguiense]
MATVQVHRVYIKATAQAIWDAITQPEWSVQYGYQAPMRYDLRPGGEFKGLASEVMKQHGSPDVLIDGEVIEVDPPHKLVQTWRAIWLEEGFTKLTFEIAEKTDGVCMLTVTHDLEGAPLSAAQVMGEVENAGGGWPELLSDLKSLLETGKSVYA